MRILVMGAGAVGGYFGGRLLGAGRDVTFLVRPARAGELALSGLQIRSPWGDAHIAAPATVVAGGFTSDFDLILLGCKAYDLESAIRAIAPAVGADTAILPLLNGMRHLDILDTAFGSRHVLGGRCLIAATLNPQREILHLNKTHSMSFGERDGSISERVLAIEAMMQGALFDHQPSGNILIEMWEKWTFLATLAGSTCLMRAAIGDICAAPGGSEFVLHLLEECRAIAEDQGFAPGAAFLERSRAILTEEGSTLTASMLRDVEAGSAIEADHVIGDLLRRGDAPLLRIVYSGLKAYEARRSRLAARI